MVAGKLFVVDLELLKVSRDYCPTAPFWSFAKCYGCKPMTVPYPPGRVSSSVVQYLPAGSTNI